ncbi:DUF2799 domain-containing protein [Motilimonas eburnea]|uniref:DUF2799 domain-containing protein n=1 Tax=Motilimonas eburnea TaxID=1737488 RepID=UPI001E625736|nr:DUF2799 domain-containing protein [Motilimonas eburnea]MCE2570436.1 DUF2799 domain-containing protein [Motilimonas eburnea]
MKTLIPLLFGLSLTACSSVDQQQLADNNQWFKIGRDDGLAGKTAKDQTQLAQLGQLPSMGYNDYEKGYNTGLDRYCNPLYNPKLNSLQDYYASVCSQVPNSYKYFSYWGIGDNI